MLEGFSETWNWQKWRFRDPQTHFCLSKFGSPHEHLWRKSPLSPSLKPLSSIL
jgi:hypothetical protein